ncbi:IQ domain-containing protein G [Ceratitis capitata]|uniref:IQ domain-containing protein G n=1 Tax=Ceratitis capitata TaxID=7213 RepID=UPI00032A1A47|nr:IQ domain-containing protein G [Ceratitis capitata]
MKHIKQLEEFVYPPLEGRELKKTLLSAVFIEASAKLNIYQRSQMINAGQCAFKESTSKSKQSSRRSSTKETSRNPDGREKAALSEKMLNEIRLDQELTSLRKIYAVALDELDDEHFNDRVKASRPHDRLLTAMEAQKPDQNVVEQALNMLRTNRETLKALKTQLVAEQEAGKDRMAEQAERIATLRHNLRNVRLLNELELRLVQRWEDNRYTQASIVGGNEERTLQQQIDELSGRLAGEERIIVAVDKFRVKQFADLNAQIEAWQRKYKRVMEIKCEETEAKERKILKLQKSLERHRETYAARQKFVRDYLAEKEVERQLYEQQIYRVECAVRIQAWWRGLMVRRGLGPFKKKTKKGKKGKGKPK